MENITLRDFCRKIKRVNDKRNHKIKNSYGIREAFLYVQKNKWFNIGHPVKEKVFQTVVREMGNKLAESMLEGNSIFFPENMGEVEVRKFPVIVDIKDGKVKTNYGIDWNETLKLWHEDDEARTNKTLVRNVNNDSRYKIVYNKKNVDYNNRSYMQFKLNRSLLNMLHVLLNEHKIDAYEC